MSEQPPKIDRAKLAKRAALAGAVLALLCNFLPPEYREVCKVVASICTGGL